MHMRVCAHTDTRTELAGAPCSLQQDELSVSVNTPPPSYRNCAGTHWRLLLLKGRRGGAEFVLCYDDVISLFGFPLL